MSAWQRNRATIERLLHEGRLEAVQPAPLSWALDQLDICGQHLQSARTIDPDRDPAGAFSLAYDACRNAGAVLLEVQGLRATADGSHTTLAEAASEQFGGPFQRLNRYGRMRNTAEYPTPQDAGVDADDVGVILADAAAMVDAARQLVEGGHLGPWRT